MKNICILIIIIIVLSFTSFAQSETFIWNGKIVSEENINLEYVHIQVQTLNSYYLFMTNHKGEVRIQYPYYLESDSVIISCIGFKTKKISCSNLNSKKNIILKSDVYQIEEVVIKARKVRLKKLGNLHNFTIQSTQINFNRQKALYIPNNSIKGKIVSARIYMHDYFDKDWKYRPFRLRLYEGNYPFEKEIIKEQIIAALKPQKNHWVEIDLSYFNINFPENGILIVVETLPFEYYKEHDYIEHRIVNGRVNSLSIGFTMTKKTRNKIQSWNYYTPKNGWVPNRDENWYYLMQIQVELYE